MGSEPRWGRLWRKTGWERGARGAAPDRTNGGPVRGLCGACAESDRRLADRRGWRIGGAGAEQSCLPRGWGAGGIHRFFGSPWKQNAKPHHMWCASSPISHLSSDTPKNTHSPAHSSSRAPSPRSQPGLMPLRRRRTPDTRPRSGPPPRSRGCWAGSPSRLRGRRCRRRWRAHRRAGWAGSASRR
jgi:hypothetical protein